MLCDDEKLEIDPEWRIAKIYMFDWQWNPLARIHLDRLLERVTYNASRNALIGVAQDESGGSAFVRIRLRTLCDRSVQNTKTPGIKFYPGCFRIAIMSGTQGWFRPPSEQDRLSDRCSRLLAELRDEVVHDSVDLLIGEGFAFILQNKAQRIRFFADR